ncbi:MAG: hypothetical protein VX938_06575, partial [Myxococcota bacterium]|nr:hypothetical protein [Myxococcota bacterium]
MYSFDHDSCNDDDTCTDDVCVAGQGCSHELNEAPCSDGNPCTDGDLCTAGVCESGAQVICDDDNPCTTEACDPASGICNYNVLEDGTSCEDGDVCTNPDACLDGLCLIGPLETGEEGIDCTVDFCDPQEGCSNTPENLFCDDGNPCTEDICIPNEGCAHETLPTLAACDDGLEGTFSDVCIEGVCRGFQTTQVNFSAGLFCQATAATASRVSDLNGNFFAVVNYDAQGLICDGERSRVMALDGADSPSGVGEFALDGTLVGLSYNLAVGDEGEVGTLVNQGSFITYFNDVQGALDDEGWDDALWSDTWGEAIYTSFGLILAERYILVGRQSDDSKVLIEVCTRQNNNVFCEKFTSGLGSNSKQAKYRPAAVDGFLLPCEDCWDVPAEDLPADFALVSNDTDGKRSLL